VLLKEALTSGIDRLSAAHVGSPRMNAEVLLMFILGRDRAYLYAHPEQDLNPQDIARYDDALSQRSQGLPAQYITGHQEFWGMDLVVSPAVLIPRPETEHIIETVLPLAKTLLKPRIVDVGTGSGAIILALTKELPGADLHATELSPPALEIAHANAARHQLTSRIHFHETDLLTGLDAESFDFVVSNPPYVGESEADMVQLEVRKFEPQSAVFAGPTGLEVIRRLVPQAHTVLKPEGWLIIEISGTIVEGVRRLLEPWHGTKIINDLQGIPRVAAAQKLP
jgi:release factor glutamine methyltransferase